MSIRVEMADLPVEILKRGSGFLLSSIMDSRPHAAHLRFEVAAADGQVQLRASAGRTARANCQMRPSVTVLFPAVTMSGDGVGEGAEDGSEGLDHSLIVDGEALVTEDEHIIVSVVGAVLHRPAPPLEDG